MWVPRRRNLEMVRNESFDAQFQLWEDDEETEPFDLSTATVTMIIGSTTFDQGSGVQVAPASDGSSGEVANQINVGLNALQTASFDPPSVRWRVRVEPFGVPLAGTCYVRDP